MRNTVKWALKVTLLTSTAVSISIPAFAQQTAEIANEEDTIVVVGSRLSRMRSIEAKRNSNTIKEIISTDELGKIADKNIGETLNRIPGLSMLVEKGEGRFVQIRGISPDLNNVTVNGMNMGSPEADGGGRLVPLDMIGGELLGGVEVIKSRTPDMDGQGIGGNVNVITKKPFDYDKDFFGFASARVGIEQYSRDDDFGGKKPFGGDLTLGGLNEEETFGWLVGGSISSREYVAPGIYQDDWREETIGSTKVAFPEEIKNNYYIIGRERINFNGTLEYRPTNTSRYFVRGFYASWDEFQHRNRFQQGLGGDVVSLSDMNGVSNGNRISANIRLEKPKKKTMNFNFGGENDFDNLLIDYEVQWGKNKLDEPYSYWEFRTGRDFGPDRWSVKSNGVVDVTPGGTLNRQDPTNFDFRRVRFQEHYMKETNLQAKFNLTYDLDNDVTLKTGAKFNQVKRDNDYSRTRYDGADETNLTLAQSGFTTGAFNNKVNGNNLPNIFMDIKKMDSFFNNNPNYFKQNTGDTFSQNFASDYNLTERIYAAYSMATYETEQVQVIGGLRVEHTDVDSEGYLRESNAAILAKSGGSYTNWLPSININFKPQNDIILRGAFTRSVGRPDFDTIAPRSTYSEETDEGKLSVGNPDLKARSAWNYDLAAEWYFNDESLISVSAFYKIISNQLCATRDVLTSQTAINSALSNFGLDGTIDTTSLTELAISTTVNRNKASIKGIELSFISHFTMLPSPFDGFGISTSVTFIDAEIEAIDDLGIITKQKMQNQPKRSTSVSLFYQKGPFESSVTYGHNESFLTDGDGTKSTDLSQGSFGRIDAKASYKISDTLKIFLEGQNLNNEPTTEFQGGNKLWNTEYEYVGRSFFVGATAAF